MLHGRARYVVAPPENGKKTHGEQAVLSFSIARCTVRRVFMTRKRKSFIPENTLIHISCAHITNDIDSFLLLLV
jgi:hypothetical protein